MAATTVTLQFQPLASHSRTLTHSSSTNSNFPTAAAVLLRRRHAAGPHLHLEKKQNSISARDPRSGMVMGDYDDEDDDDIEEDEDEDRSLDLLVRFVENVFRKVSRKARKAVKAVLPVPISTRLVGFAVNGTIILTFLWVLKAFLEVICTLGSVVFASILLIRGIWTGISYFQESRTYRADEDDEPQSWTGRQPAI